MANDDYQLEELENAAVNKSNNAKRMAAAAGLLAAGGTAGYAASNISTGSVEETEDILSEEDLESGAKTETNQVQGPESKEQTPPQTPHDSEVNGTTQEEVNIDYDKTTHYYDEDHNLVMTTEEGTIDGKDFLLVDYDNDSEADIIAYDENGNGTYEQNEVHALGDNEHIAMGNDATQHEDVFLANQDPDPEPIESYDIDDEKDLADDNTIQNDFEDEKTGESYSHDYAENNEDYNNGDEPYSAEPSDDYAYQEDTEDESDYEYKDLADNDTTDDSFDDSDSLDIV